MALRRLADRLLLVALLAGGAGCQTGLSYDPAPMRFNVDRFIHGMSASREDCAKYANRVWVTVDGANFCIRYFASELADDPEFVQVYLSGDLQAGVVWDLYDRLTPPKLDQVAETWTQREDVPHVFLARPGTFGSSGKHGDDMDRTGREARIMGAAIDRLKEKYGLRSLSLVGQSGGGHIVAYLAAHRVDVRCATMSSAPLSLDHVAKIRSWHEEFDDYADGFWNPIENLDAVVRLPQRRLFVLADQRDQIVPFDGAKAYAEKAKGLGIDGALIEAKAKDQDSHGLSAMGVQVGAACSKGVPTAEIIRKHQS